MGWGEPHWGLQQKPAGCAMGVHGEVGLGCGGWDGMGGSGWGAGVRLALGATELPLILLVCGFA